MTISYEEQVLFISQHLGPRVGVLIVTFDMSRLI